MSAAETIRFSAPKAASQTWRPTDRDRLIFQWVKFDGHKQSWVATQLGMHQTTVSRIVDRYERWIAHGGPSQEGSLSRDERLRAQRWLTYERNEWILTSALRIAGEMELPIDISKSNIKKQPRDHTKELEVRTEHAVLHRSGLAARFLRLAHRINMDQQKLVERDPLPDLEPLSHEDLAPGEDNLPAVCHGPPARAADCDWAGSPDPYTASTPSDDRVTVVAGSPDPATAPTEGLPTVWHGPPARADRANDVSPADDRSNVPCGLAERDQSPATSPEPTTTSSPPMHPMHTNTVPASPLTNSPINLYDQNHATKKTQTPAYTVAPSPPESTNPDQSIAFGARMQLIPDP